MGGLHRYIYLISISFNPVLLYADKNKMIIWAGEGWLGGVSLPPSHGKSKKANFQGGLRLLSFKSTELNLTITSYNTITGFVAFPA